MKKIVFAGPTLHGIDLGAFPSLDFRPPAQRGDIVRAAGDGATAIGLIDGVFERTPSVWHKEILLALSKGIAMLGAASMGALRAAECQPFGMIGVGEVFEAYARGETDDDADVAQLHGPPELGYLPLSEPLVNIRATLRSLLAAERISRQERDALTAAAEALFFKDRTYRRIVDTSSLPEERKTDVAQLLKINGVNIKQQDAMLLLTLLEGREPLSNINVHQFEWRLAWTRPLHDLLGDVSNC
jgi:hypothetical protein